MEQVEKNFEKIMVSRNVSAKSNETHILCEHASHEKYYEHSYLVSLLFAETFLLTIIFPKFFYTCIFTHFFSCNYENFDNTVLLLYCIRVWPHTTHYTLTIKSLLCTSYLVRCTQQYICLRIQVEGIWLVQEGYFT